MNVTQVSWYLYLFNGRPCLTAHPLPSNFNLKIHVLCRHLCYLSMSHNTEICFLYVGGDATFDYISVTPPYMKVDYGLLMQQLSDSSLIGEDTFIVSFGILFHNVIHFFFMFLGYLYWKLCTFFYSYNFQHVMCFCF